MSETQIPSDKLLSCGTPTDSATIQFLETLSIAGIVVAIGAAVLTFWPGAVIALLVTSGSTVLALRGRKTRIRENEVEARFARYRFITDREKTIDGLAVPDDVKSAIKALAHVQMVSEKSLTRFEVAEHLKIRIGQARATQFLPVALQQADRSLTMEH